MNVPYFARFFNTIQTFLGSSILKSCDIIRSKDDWLDLFEALWLLINIYTKGRQQNKSVQEISLGRTQFHRRRDITIRHVESIGGRRRCSDVEWRLIQGRRQVQGMVAVATWEGVRNVKSGVESKLQGLVWRDARYCSKIRSTKEEQRREGGEGSKSWIDTIVGPR